MGKKGIKDAFDAPGRYPGDLRAVIEHNPIANYPWRVTVGEWGALWQEESCWSECQSFLDDFQTADFKTAKRAVRYRNKVLMAADLGHIARLEARRVDAQWKEVL